LEGEESAENKAKADGGEKIPGGNSETSETGFFFSNKVIGREKPNKGFDQENFEKLGKLEKKAIKAPSGEEKSVESDDMLKAGQGASLGHIYLIVHHRWKKQHQWRR